MPGSQITHTPPSPVVTPGERAGPWGSRCGGGGGAGGGGHDGGACDGDGGGGGGVGVWVRGPPALLTPAPLGPRAQRSGHALGGLPALRTLRNKRRLAGQPCNILTRHPSRSPPAPSHSPPN